MLFEPVKIDAQRREGPDILLLVYSHFGVVDSWLPILCEVKKQRRDLSIGVIISAKALSLINLDDFVTREADKVIDLVMVKGRGQNWRTAKTFEEARASLVAAKPMAFYRSLFGPNITTKTLASCSGAVLFDILDQKTKAVRDLQVMLPDAQWFSLPHGIDRIETKEYLREKMIKKIDYKIFNRITVYAASRGETETYIDWFGINGENVKVVGVPRHCETWVDKIPKGQPEDWMNTKYILIVSKPASDVFLPTKRKLQALIDIRRVAEEIGARIIVRLHPSEGVKVPDIFKDGLGAEGFGKTWTISASHSIALGRQALCAVTFFSSVAVDMAAQGVPVIEACDFTGLVDAPQLPRDERGNPTSSYQKLGLVLGARNHEELRRHILDIMADRGAVTNRLRRAYERVYERIPNSVAVIAQDILTALDRA